jgi:predicted ester cyclase
VGPDTLRGAKAFRGLLVELTRVFPDLQATLSTAFGAGDYGIFEVHFAGTQKGPIGPIKPTNKGTDVHELQVNQFKDGRMFRSWSWSNGAELMSELGIPLPSAPSASVAPGASAKP